MIEPVTGLTVAPQLAFVVGMPRAGTTWLARCLQDHSAVTVLPETGFWGRWYFPPGRDGRYRPDQVEQLVERLTDCLTHHIGVGTASYHHLAATDCPALVAGALRALERPTPAAAFAAVAAAVARAEGRGLVVEKTPSHVLAIDRIVAAVPTARFVVAVREPTGFLLSYKHQGDRMSGEDHDFFRRLYHPLVCAWQWRRSLAAAEDARRRFPERTLVVRFDQLTSAPEPTLATVQAFLGLAPETLARAPLGFDSSFPGGARPPPDGADRAWLAALTARPARRFGWEVARDRGSTAAAFASLLALPWWAVRAAFALRGRAVSPGYFLAWLRR